MRNTSNYVESLGQTALFSACTRDQLRMIARFAEVIKVEADVAIIAEGAIGHEFYVIAEGQAVVRRQGRDVAELGPGGYFGELALLVRAPRNSAVVSLTPMKLYVLGEREFSGLLAEVPTLAKKVLQGMAARIRAADLVPV